MYAWLNEPDNLRRRLSQIFCAALLLSALEAAAAPMPRVEWYSADGMSHLHARAFASAGSERKEACTVAILNERPFCHWCRQFDRCKKQTPSATSPFAANDHSVAAVNSPPRFDASVESTAFQEVRLKPAALHLSSRVVTSMQNRGTGVPANRGIVNASGEIFFRVPPGMPLDYELNGSLQWEGARAHIQIVAIPNTGASLKNGFGFNTNHLPKGAPAELARQGTLTPGAYKLHWFVVGSQISRGGSQGGALEADLNFFAACDPVAGQKPIAPYVNEAVGFFGPYDSPDQVVIAMEPIVTEATQREKRELGWFLVQDRRNKKFYATPPVWGASALMTIVVGGVSGEDYDRSASLANRTCEHADKFFSFDATVHSHPEQFLSRDRPNVFSGRDFNHAIADAKKKQPRLKRIYLLPPNRCIQSFAAKPDDEPCDELLACPKYYPRVQAVHNCPKGVIRE